MEATNTADTTSNGSLHLQNPTTEFSAPQLRPRRNSAPQEYSTNPTSQPTTNNTTIQTQKRKCARNCYCGLEPILREVKANTANKGRFFWSCSKYGGLNYCNFFRWDSSMTQNADGNCMVAESSTSSTAQNKSDNVSINNDGEVNLLPEPDQLSGNEVRSVTRTGLIATTTPLTTPHQRRRRASFSQVLSNNANKTTAAAGTNNTHTTCKPAVFSNWENVPRYSTLQLTDIMQNHLVQQDKNYQRWYTATQLARQDFEAAKKEVEKLTGEFEVVNRENNLYKRENNVLKAEKRLLEFENGELKEENHELKRRH